MLIERNKNCHEIGTKKILCESFKWKKTLWVISIDRLHFITIAGRFYKEMLQIDRISSSIFIFSPFTESLSFSSTTEPASYLAPYFDMDVQKNLTVTIGQTAFLHCRVERLGDKDVSKHGLIHLHFHYYSLGWPIEFLDIDATIWFPFPHIHSFIVGWWFCHYGKEMKFMQFYINWKKSSYRNHGTKFDFITTIVLRTRAKIWKLYCNLTIRSWCSLNLINPVHNHHKENFSHISNAMHSSL